MDLTGNTVLITGGASGIGLALAGRFLAAGSEVIVCGRREDKLRAAKVSHPQLTTRVCDVATETGRMMLVDWALHERPRLNVLINNAGIQRYPSFVEGEDWQGTHEEIAINLEAPVHLSALCIPHLHKQTRSAIINVTSGLGFAPMARAPIYSATKAAMHSFTVSLRHQLSQTPIQVIEVIPPAVDTDLGGPGLHTFGVNVDAFADHAIAGIRNGDLEVAYGFAEQASRASRTELDEMVKRMNQARS